MIIYEDPDAILLHYGVKGMRWGVRRPHPSYSHEQQMADRKSFGKGGVRRINRRLKRGRTHEQAQKTEKRLRTVKRTAAVIYGAIVVHNLLQTFGGDLSSRIAARAATKRGEAAILGIGMWKPIVAKSAGGAFKITTL